MGKLITFISIISGLTLLFYFTGLLENTPNATLLNLLLNPEEFQDTTLSLKLTTALALILSSAVVVGFAAAGNVELGVNSLFVTYLASLLWDIIYIFDKIASANKTMAILLMGPIIFIYVITIIEWWGKRD